MCKPLNRRGLQNVTYMKINRNIFFLVQFKLIILKRRYFLIILKIRSAMKFIGNHFIFSKIVQQAHVKIILGQQAHYTCLYTIKCMYEWVVISHCYLHGNHYNPA